MRLLRHLFSVLPEKLQYFDIDPSGYMCYAVICDILVRKQWVDSIPITSLHLQIYCGVYGKSDSIDNILIL